MSQNYPQSSGSIGQGTGSQMGGQMGQMGGQMSQQTGSGFQTAHQQVGHQFESELTPELNEALESFDRVVEVASWCADKCIEMGPQMAECARLCDDLAELAELNEKLIARDSINGPEVAETFLRVAQQGIPILQQYQESPHVQETLQTVTYAIDATDRLLNSISGPAMGTQEGFQEMSQQGGTGQQMQGQMSPQSQGQMTQQPQGQMNQTGGQMGQQSGGQMGQTSQRPQGQMGQQYQSQGGSQQPQGQGFQSQSEFQSGPSSY